MEKASQPLPWDRHLILEECAVLLNEGGRGSACYWALYDTLPEDVRTHPRMVLQKSIALCRAGQCEQAQEMLDKGLIFPISAKAKARRRKSGRRCSRLSCKKACSTGICRLQWISECTEQRAKKAIKEI